MDNNEDNDSDKNSLIGPTFMCDYCGKYVFTLQGIWYYYNKHNNLLKYKCDKCDYMTNHMTLNEDTYTRSDTQMQIV